MCQNIRKLYQVSKAKNCKGTHFSVSLHITLTQTQALKQH